MSEDHPITSNGGDIMPSDRQEVEVYDRILKRFRLARYIQDETSGTLTGWFRVYGLDLEVPSHGGRFIKWRPLEEQ